MRTLVAIGLGLALTAGLWSGIPRPVLADDLPTNPGNPAAACDPGPVYVPGSSLGAIRIGMPLGALQPQFGRPLAVDNRQIQGHQWTRLRYPGLDVLGRDNSVVAVNMPQPRPVPVRTRCGTLVKRPLSLSRTFVQQSYGPPSANFALNGLQYWLYNALGVLFTWITGSPYVQSVMVFPVGEYCGVTPVLVSFGAFSVQAVNVVTSCARNAGDRER